MKVERCIICDKQIIKNNKPNKSRSSAEVTNYYRRYNAITCSHKCSIIYYKVYHRIKDNMRYKPKKKQEDEE